LLIEKSESIGYLQFRRIPGLFGGHGWMSIVVAASWEKSESYGPVVPMVLTR